MNKYLLVLPGGSERNRAWGESCAEFFRASFDMVIFMHYDHWGTGEKNLDFTAELQKIAENVRGAGEGEWYIFAKSIGSVLALKATKQGIINPVKCVFFGMPLEIVSQMMDSEDWATLSEFSVPAIAFHNEQDPTAEYAFTSKKLAKYAPHITLKPLAGDTHDYLDFSSYDTEIKSFIGM